MTNKILHFDPICFTFSKLPQIFLESFLFFHFKRRRKTHVYFEVKEQHFVYIYKRKLERNNLKIEEMKQKNGFF